MLSALREATTVDTLRAATAEAIGSVLESNRKLQNRYAELSQRNTELTERNLQLQDQLRELESKVESGQQPGRRLQQLSKGHTAHGSNPSSAWHGFTPHLCDAALGGKNPKYLGALTSACCDEPSEKT